MIFEFLNFALICLTVFFITLIFSFYRSTKYKIFDNRNFSKKLYQNLYIGNSETIAIKTLIRYLGILSLVIAISGIKTGVTVKPVERKGVDIVFCVDVSLRWILRILNLQELIKLNLNYQKSLIISRGIGLESLFFLAQIFFIYP